MSEFMLPMLELESGDVVNLDRIDCMLRDPYQRGEIEIIVVGDAKCRVTKKDMERITEYLNTPKGSPGLLMDSNGFFIHDPYKRTGGGEDETALHDKFRGIAKEIERHENTFNKMDFTLHGSLPIGLRCPRDREIMVGSDGCTKCCRFFKGIHWGDAEENRTYVRCTWDASEKE